MSKTTWAASVIGLAFIGLTTALITGKIDATAYGLALGAIGTLGAAVIGWLSQDQLPKKQQDAINNITNTDEQ